MIRTSRLLRETVRCIGAGPSLRSMWRRFRFVPWKDWLTPSKALLFLAVRPYTMLPYARLSQLYALAERCNRERIPGAFVQCGVWRGGSAAVLATIAQKGRRRLYLYDSFQGCPEPGPMDITPQANRPGERGEACAPQTDVESLLTRLGIVADGWLHIFPGWFQESIPLTARAVDKIALLHLDADWYESTSVCMQHLYPRVVHGGFVYCDDFGYWNGAREAVVRSLAQYGDFPKDWHWVDHTGVWWRKP